MTKLNKKTIFLSKLDSIVRDLKTRKKEYELIVLDKIKGIGLNDIEDNKHYLIRKLSYDNYVIIEQYIQTKDSDLDDLIVSRTFFKDSEPKTWKPRIKK